MRQECELKGPGSRSPGRAGKAFACPFTSSRVCSFGACEGKRIRADTANIEEGASCPYDSARRYWQHRQSVLILGFINLLRELGKQFPHVQMSQVFMIVCRPTTQACSLFATQRDHGLNLQTV